MAEPPDTLAGGRKKALAPMVSAAVAAERVFAVLRAGEWLANEMVTNEQGAALAVRDPRLPPGTVWRRPRGVEEAAAPAVGLGEKPMTTSTPDQVERFHRRRKARKAIDPPIRKRCSSPTCPSHWERLADSPYCCVAPSWCGTRRHVAGRSRREEQT
jgi:hypothetical protein